MANISITAKFVLQAAKLYHKEQSPGTETLSVNQVIFIINLLVGLVALL